MRESLAILPIYQATLSLLAHKKSYNNLDLYKTAIENTEFQLLQALWKHFNFHESIDKVRLLRCQEALGIENMEDFKNLIIKHELLSKTKLNLLLGNDTEAKS